MIHHELKCIFLHPNKCGGKSIEKAIWNVDAKRDSADHRGPDSYKNEYGIDVWNDYYKFGFCRNPWARMVSIYHGRKQILKTADTKCTFEEWMASDFIKKIKLQTFWLVDDLDFIGRVERYDADFEIVAKRLNIDTKLPHLNKSEHDSYTEYYNDKRKDVVYKLFKEDINKFGYEFEEGQIASKS